MNVRFNHPRSIMVGCLFLLPLTMLLPNCRPELDEEEGVRLGFLNEFCTADTDCQSELVCDNSACQAIDTPGSISCRDMCDRLVDTCGRAEGDCEGSCRETIKGWSAEAINVFGDCTLGNSMPPLPKLTCELATEEDAPSFCYRQIPLDSARQLRCDTFVDQARSYASGSTEGQLTELRQKCYILARTRSDADWSVTAECDETNQTLTAEEVVSCYNAKFDLNL